MRSTIGSRGHHTNCLETSQAPQSSFQVKCPPLSTTTNIHGLDDGSSNRNPTFSHYRWNQHDATTLLLPRSSNMVEGWHHGFRSMLSYQNPSIWKFLECLKKEQSLTKVKMTKMMMREKAEPRLVKWRRYRLQRIVMIFNDYSTVTDCLRCISNLA